VPAAAEPQPHEGDAPEVNASGGEKSCPSAFCHEGALLLGVMTPSGRLSYVQPPTRVDADFVARAEAMGRPESRFRFSAPAGAKSCGRF
jgi:hypothetical protein